MAEKKTDKIHFHYQTQSFYFPNRTGLKYFLLDQLEKKGKSVEAINYVFCDDEYLLQINKTYLQHDTYTDIITFELSEKKRPLFAEIYISVERVKENALTYRNPFLTELHKVVFHGALHLTGYSDKSKLKKKEMRIKEEEWLSFYNVSRGRNKV